MKKTILSLAISSLSLLSSVHAATNDSVVTASVQSSDELHMSDIIVGALDPTEPVSQMVGLPEEQQL